VLRILDASVQTQVATTWFEDSGTAGDSRSPRSGDTVTIETANNPYCD
jgi:hypothetical protein